AATQQRGVVRKGLIAPDLSALETLRENGMEVTVVDTATRRAFIEKTMPVRQEWTAKIGAELVNKAAAAIAAAQ
ncbi:MAG: C4-dicarboxylate ABC transporter, partial [Deltaproteobacteria bacterium]|nr:C4-dicarboxylate ABC transporter [Candidatus Anaeroferrophillacea bacterium]